MLFFYKLLFFSVLKTYTPHHPATFPAIFQQDLTEDHPDQLYTKITFIKMDKIVSPNTQDWISSCSYIRKGLFHPQKVSFCKQREFICEWKDTFESTNLKSHVKEEIFIYLFKRFLALSTKIAK